MGSCHGICICGNSSRWNAFQLTMANASCLKVLSISIIAAWIRLPLREMCYQCFPTLHLFKSSFNLQEPDCKLTKKQPRKSKYWCRARYRLYFYWVLAWCWTSPGKTVIQIKKSIVRGVWYSHSTTDFCHPIFFAYISFFALFFSLSYWLWL